MRRSSSLLVACVTMFVVAAFTPAAAAEPIAVDRCSRECDPQAINDNEVKTGKDPVNIILYGHFQNMLDNAPLNTQPPDPNFEPDLNGGFSLQTIDTNTDVCAPGTQTCADFHFKNNQFTMFSSPGLVEFLSDGGWRTHQEPGLAGDAKIVGPEMRLYWYLSAHALPGMNSGSGAGATAKAGAMPQVGVYARMETGRFEFHGEKIAESADFDANSVGSPERANMVTLPNQPDVYEFQVKMNVLKDTIPNSHLANGFIVYVNPYQVKTDPQEGVQFAQADWRLRTGPLFMPRVIIPMEEPMRTLGSALSIFDERMFVRWSFISAMGSYDMRDSQLKLDVTGPAAVDPKAVDFIILKRSVDHDGHFKPVNATWAIDYLNFPMADGDYELTASIPNLQGTYLLVHKFPFKVVNGKPDVYEIGAPGSAPGAVKETQPGGDSPGLGVAALLATIVGVAVVARRRP
jgi:hypothetical protein